jgi:hypothetical protein
MAKKQKAETHGRRAGFPPMPREMPLPPEPPKAPPTAQEVAPVETGVKYLDGETFRNEGYLQEANRQFFHPLGLALELDLKANTLRVWDCRDDSEGIRFVHMDLRAKADLVDAQRQLRRIPRMEKLGYFVQPAFKD